MASRKVEIRIELKRCWYCAYLFDLAWFYVYFGLVGSGPAAYWVVIHGYRWRIVGERKWRSFK